MELAQLRYFLKIVEHRNFTRAAKACQVSQPALSQQIGKLEKELGMSLFERQGRVTRLTNAGKILRTNAEKILALVGDIERQINDDGSTGTVVVSTTPTVGPFLTTKLLHNLNKQFSEADIQLTEESPDSLHTRCCNREVDFTISELDSAWEKRLVCEPILKEDIQVVMSSSHSLVNKQSLTIEDIRDQPLILMSKKQLLTRKVEKFLAEFGVSIDTVARVEQFSTLQHLVALGKGISFVPRMAVNPKFKKDLCYKPVAGYDLSRVIGISWSEERFQTQLVGNMIKAIRELADPQLLMSAAAKPSQNKKSKPKKVKVPSASVPPAPSAPSA